MTLGVGVSQGTASPSFVHNGKFKGQHEMDHTGSEMRQAVRRLVEALPLSLNS